MPLTDTDRKILATERLLWEHPGNKERHVRAELDVSMTTYYAMVQDLIDNPEAEAFDPLTVRRLRRVRASRQRSRSARRMGLDV